MIVKNYSLTEFKKEHGKCSLGELRNSKSGEKFAALKFGNVLVTFSGKLGPLTGTQLKERKNNLQIVQLDSGSFKLCNIGTPTNWEDVDF